MKLAIPYTIDIGHFLPLIPVVEYQFKDTKTTSIDGYSKKACFLTKRGFEESANSSF